MSHTHEAKIQKTSKTFDQILEKSGYKLHATIGNGSYAKVK